MTDIEPEIVAQKMERERHQGCPHLLLLWEKACVRFRSRMNTAGQPVFALAFIQETLAGLAGAGVFQSMRRHTDDNECGPTELLCVSQCLNGIRLRVNHAKGSTTLDAVLSNRNDFAATADEGNMGVITPMFSRVAVQIGEDCILHVALDPSWQLLCGRHLTDGHSVCGVVTLTGWQGCWGGHVFTKVTGYGWGYGGSNDDNDSRNDISASVCS